SAVEWGSAVGISVACTPGACYRRVVVTAKRFVILVCACSMAMLLWPPDALAQRRGGGRGGGGGGPAPGARPSGGQGGYNGGGHGGYRGGYNGGYRGGYYRPGYYY